MDFSEIIVFLASCFFTYKFLSRWYRQTLGGTPLKRNVGLRLSLALLPVASLITVYYTLIKLASFDVVDSEIYILFYLLIGMVWLYFGLSLMFFFFDLSWIDDVLNMCNSAAAAAVIGGGLGITVIYAGANIGDGPGWWCVFFAGGLGLAAWVLLGVIANAVTGIFRQITVDRDIFCGIRTGAYLLSSGIILGRASAGDWTSFLSTAIEFLDGWPVLILTAVFILLELLFAASKRAGANKALSLYFSLLLGVAYIAAAIFALYALPPLPVNPIYSLVKV
ncbi:MAG: hypothetical protein LBS74_10835 [Oscillospiraceae bacterium]|jgi:hypothetical protein|nr:hypothetical protein [Oscillospiraceae bacterium]